MTGGPASGGVVMSSHSNDSVVSHDSSQPVASQLSPVHQYSVEPIPNSPRPTASTSPRVADTSTPTIQPTSVQASPVHHEQMHSGEGDLTLPSLPNLGETTNAQMLGVQQLERQQAQLEYDRAVAAQSNATTRQGTGFDDTPVIPHRDDDDDTAPSSTMAHGDENPAHPQQNGNIPHSTSFGRFFFTPLQNVRSRSSSVHSHDGHGTTNKLRTDGNAMLSPMAGDDDEEDMWRGQVKPLVYGYLYKLGRNGQWQKRFFETDGECLTYYKSSKRSKILATLDLCKVGEIAVDKSDPAGCTFVIQVADRPYYLRTDDSAICKDWVIMLNRIREARVQLGGVQLITPQFSKADRVRTDSTDYAPRVVVSANRERTHRATDGDAYFMPEVSKTNFTSPDRENPFENQELVDFPANASPSNSIRFNPQLMARWEKRRTSLQRLKSKLARWARRIRAMRCVGREDGVMLGPATYDNPYEYDRTVASREEKIEEGDESVIHGSPEGSSGPSAWIGKEKEFTLRANAMAEPEPLSGNPGMQLNLSPSVKGGRNSYDEEEDNIRHLDRGESTYILCDFVSVSMFCEVCMNLAKINGS